MLFVSRAGEEPSAWLEAPQPWEHTLRPGAEVSAV